MVEAILNRNSREFWRVDLMDNLVLEVGTQRVTVRELRADFWTADNQGCSTQIEAIQAAERQMRQRLGYAPWAPAHRWKWGL